GKTRDVDVRDTPVKRIVRRQVDPELFNNVYRVCARGAVCILQPAESETHIVYFIRTVDACVGEQSLLYFSVRIDSQVRNRKRIVTVLGGVTVTEEPIRLCMFRPIDPICELVRVDEPAFIVYEICSARIVLRKRKVSEQLSRDGVNPILRNDVSAKWLWRD